jgi:hypothetical protein
MDKLRLLSSFLSDERVDPRLTAEPKMQTDTENIEIVKLLLEDERVDLRADPLISALCALNVEISMAFL